LEDAYGHVESEKIEGSLIAVSDAGLSPNTVMIQLVNTGATIAAV
jgi:hypothetical protein